MRLLLSKSWVLSVLRCSQNATVLLCMVLVTHLMVSASLIEANAQTIVINENDQDKGRISPQEPGHPIDTAHSTQPTININVASAEELASFLPGIGPSKAQRIVAWRLENGQFSSLDQLLEINGIGPKTLANIVSLVRISDELSQQQKSTNYPNSPQQLASVFEQIVRRAERDALCNGTATSQSTSSLCAQ